MMSYVSPVLSILMFLNLTCGAEQVRHSGGDRVSELPVSATAIIRQPLLHENQPAALRMEAVRSRPKEIALRIELAELYERDGYSVMANLFRASVDVARGSSISWSRRSSNLWACGNDEQSRTAAVRAWNERLNQADWHAVRQETTEELSRDPLTCTVRLIHAKATLSEAMFRVDQITPAERELAVRTWLTLSDEGNVIAAGSPDIVSVYIETGDYFSAVGDTITALAAYHIARLRIGEAVAPELVESQIDERIQRLEGKR